MRTNRQTNKQTDGLKHATHRTFYTRRQSRSAAWVKSKRMSAVDVVIAVSPGTVQAAQNAGTGYWTDWINADPIMQYGTGEFEECSRIWLEQGRSGKCYLDCSTPLAAQYSLVYKQSIATWTDIGLLTIRVKQSAHVEHANDAKTFLKHFSDCLCYF